ncbi:MAG: TetR/AcrR family transcriptional regulator [Cyanobacteria bacterium P01_H01_bin.74]
MNSTRKPQRKKPGPGKSPERSSAILSTAAKLFFKQGYTQTTMDMIAAQANVSKLTVYKHFGSKQALFEAMIHQKMEENLSQSTYKGFTGKAPHQELCQIAQGFINIVYSHEGLSIYRLVISESNNPNSVIPALFYEQAILKSCKQLENYLEKVETHYQYCFNPKPHWVSFFFGLFDGISYKRSLLGIYDNRYTIPGFNDVENSVSLFLKINQKHYDEFA